LTGVIAAACGALKIPRPFGPLNDREGGMSDKPRGDRIAGKADGSAPVGRRGFLGLLGAAMTNLEPPAAIAGKPDDEKRKPLYRETEHVKTFYRLNRY